MSHMDLGSAERSVGEAWARALRQRQAAEERAQGEPETLTLWVTWRRRGDQFWRRKARVTASGQVSLEKDLAPQWSTSGRWPGAGWP